ncbi:MAG: hypothetical protein JWN70_654 [Planctomycetaceae bacterium]|nr:hypothetical protein [Planctomycetaceae bacterium]
MGSDRTAGIVLTVAVLLLVVLIAPYFRSPKKLETHPVTGKITFKEDGSPLTGAILVAQVLTPEGGGPRAIAEIQPDGSFILETELKGDGAVAGEHLMILNSKPPGSMEALATVVHGKYLDFGKSPWKFTFEPHTENHFDLEVEKPEKGSKTRASVIPSD